MIGERWMYWTLGEAGMKTLTKLLQKVVGITSAIFSHVLLATIIIGIVQTIFGFISCKYRNIKLFSNAKEIVGACIFGLFAFGASVLGFSVFLLGGDMGVNTFIITLSIIPGAIIDQIFFKHKLAPQQWIGVFIAIIAGYTILECPSISQIATLPLWVWLSFGAMVLVAINQGITQKIKSINPMLKNFWGGLTTTIFALIVIITILYSGKAIGIEKTNAVFWSSSFLIGFIVVLMWTCNVMSYKQGAYIALKKLVMNGAYLTAIMILGSIFFPEEHFTSAKLYGVFIYLLAFCLIDEGTWKFISSSMKPQEKNVNS